MSMAGVLVGLLGMLLGGVVIPRLVVTGRVMVMLGRLGVMLRGVHVMLRGPMLVRHFGSPCQMRKLNLLSSAV